MHTPTFGAGLPQGFQVPNSRYILPQFEERTAYGYRDVSADVKLPP